MDKLDEIVRQRAEARQDQHKWYCEQSRERLKKNIASKIRTVMIGNLARLENRLGHLWGQGRPSSSLSEREMAMQAIKEELRTDILNHGNNLLRAAMSEIDQYHVEWVRNQYYISVEENNAQECNHCQG